MPIPNFQALMLPLLELAGDRLEHSFKDAIPFLEKKFYLTEHEKKELLPSSKQSKFNKRVYLAKTHLFKAGLLDSDRRNAFKITAEGLKVLAIHNLSIDTKFLERYDTYRQFRTPAQLKKYILLNTTTTDLAIAKETPATLVRVGLWGNSLGVQIPQQLAEATQLQEGDEIEIYQQEDELILKPKKKQYILE